MSSEKKYRYVLILAPICACVAGFSVAFYQLDHPEIPGWVAWAFGFIGLFIPFLMIPRSGSHQSLLYVIFKLVCHLTCLPLGFLPVFGLIWIFSLIGIQLNGEIFGKVGAVAGIFTAIALSYFIERRFFQRRNPASNG